MKDPRSTLQVCRGFTLIELMLTLIIVAVGIALAVPTVESITQRRHATAKAEQLASFLANARSESVKSNRQLSVQLTHTSDDSWCIGADDDTDGCDCLTANACTVGTTEFRLDSSDMPKSKMTEHSADTTFIFDPVRGIKRSDDLAFHSYVIRSDNNAYELQVSISPTGRVVVCNPDSDLAVPGYKDCSAASVPAAVPPPTP